MDLPLEVMCGLSASPLFYHSDIVRCSQFPKSETIILEKKKRQPVTHFRNVPSSLTPQFGGIYASLESFQTSHKQSYVLKALSDVKVD